MFIRIHNIVNNISHSINVQIKTNKIKFRFTCAVSIKKIMRKILNFNISRNSSLIMIGTQHFIGEPIMFAFCKEKIENTKGVIRSHKSKNTRHNGDQNNPGTPNARLDYNILRSIFTKRSGDTS